MIQFEQNSIQVSGELDRNTVPELYQIDIPFPKFSNWKVDLAKAVRVDSAGLALLIDWNQRATEAGCSMEVANASEEFLGLVRLCKLEAILEKKNDDNSGSN